jgi:four helix bundle protein
MEREVFTFERLDVYRVAREAMVIAVEKRAALRALPGDLRRQLERALVSVVAGISEGSGRATSADRRHFFTVARGSANEAGALVEIAHVLRARDDAEHTALRTRLLRVTWMLTAMMR